MAIHPQKQPERGPAAFDERRVQDRRGYRDDLVPFPAPDAGEGEDQAEPLVPVSPPSKGTLAFAAPSMSR